MEPLGTEDVLRAARSESYHLPDTLEQWRTPEKSNLYWKPWEHLRSFFRGCGYELYVRDSRHGERLVPRGTVQHCEPDAFGVYGTRSYVPHFYPVGGTVWPARNRDGMDVVIKVVSNTGELVEEVAILKYLSSEPVKSHVDNPIVPLIEILHHDHWAFTVQPRWGSSVEPAFQSIRECLDFCIQVTRGVAFLHRHFIAHLDIAEENILMNVLGTEQTDTNLSWTLRSRFPVRYGFIDFGQSRRFEADKTPHLADVYTGRFTKAPEFDLHQPYDPFAADVYQTGATLGTLFWRMAKATPEFSPIINAMLHTNSTQRISMNEASQRFQTLRGTLSDQILPQRIDITFIGYIKRAPETKEELENLLKV